MPLFGQVVVGPPGAGKSTYCLGMQMFCNAIGRKAAIVNLDFANDVLPYTATIDVRKLITLQVEYTITQMIFAHLLQRLQLISSVFV